MNYSRQIRDHYQLQKIIEAFFISELSTPSKEIWIVSPWISNLNIVDNNQGQYSSLFPEWPKSFISLSLVLNSILENGTKVNISTRPFENQESNREIINFVESLKKDENYGHLVILKTDNTLHEKGLIHDSLYLAGSMNLTMSGVNINKEVVEVRTDLESINNSIIEFKDYFNE